MLSGRSSSLRCAGEVRRIYEESAPLISLVMKPLARGFLAEVINIVKRSVDKGAGVSRYPRRRSEYR